MIVVDKKNIVMGSNAVKSESLPNHNPSVRKRKGVKKEEHAYVQEHKAYKKSRSKAVYGTLALFFVLSMVTISRVNLIYENQKTIETYKSEIKTKSFLRDSMKMETRGYSLKELESMSGDYEMKRASQDELTYVDFSNDYFDNAATIESESKQGFFNKLVEFLF